MITVHHLQVSQSERIVWLFEELGVPYELKIYQRTPAGAAPPDYKALHPQGTAPIITDGAFALAETGAIVDYVIQKLGEGRLAVNPSAPNFADYLYWLHYGNGTFVPGAMMAHVANSLSGGNKDVAAPFFGRLEQGFRLSEQRLALAPYFAGDDFTAADIMMSYPLTSLSVAALSPDLLPYPHINAYLSRIRARPAYARAMANG